MNKPTTVDQYLTPYPENQQRRMEELRAIIREEAPDAEEIISYGMPAYRGNQNIVYFAGAKAHLGFYPTDSGIQNFKHEFGDYKWSKGAIQFPYDKPLPEDLIRRIVRLRVKEDAALKPRKGKG